MHDTIDTIRNLGGYVTGMHAERITLLAIVLADSPMKISQVADKVGMSRGAMTDISDRLVAQGLVTRVLDGDDRRVVRLEATRLGRKAVERASA
jgi:DNA-binding MarR family transcriptional regulator